LPSGALSSFTDKPNLRIAVRVLIPVCAALFAFAPMVFGFFIGDNNLMNGEHGGHPFYIGDRVWNQGRMYYPNIWIMIIVLTLVTLVLNLPRMYRAVMEVVDASAMRRQREREQRTQVSLGQPEEHDAVA